MSKKALSEKCIECGSEHVYARGKCINCYRRELRRENKMREGKKEKKDPLIGQQFGKWTVVDKTDKRDSGGRILYKCVCKCGTVGMVAGTFLRQGKSKSCGCSRIEAAEKVHARNRMHQQIIDLYQKGYSYTTVADLVDCAVSTVRRVVNDAGVGKPVYSPRKESYKVADYNERAIVKERLNDAIKPSEILEKRLNTHVWDRIEIPTMKCAGGEKELSKDSMYTRTAVVVSVDHPRFCVTRIERTGIMECVSWVDLVMKDKIDELLAEGV